MRKQKSTNNALFILMFVLSSFSMHENVSAKTKLEFFDLAGSKIAFAKHDEIPSKTAFVLFHGFPAQKSRGEDFAEFIFDNSDLDVFVLFYDGLHKDGKKFSFLDTFNQASRLIRELKRRGYQQVDVFGMSWGGCVAIDVAARRELPVGKLTLLAPFTMIPPRTDAERIISKYYKLYPDLIHESDVPKLVDEIEVIRREHNPIQGLKRIGQSIPLTIIHGSNDDEVPISASRHIQTLGINQIDFIELTEEDHSFSQRELIRELVLQSFAR